MRTSRRTNAGVMSTGRRFPEDAQTPPHTVDATPARLVPFHGADRLGRRLEGLQPDRTTYRHDDSSRRSEPGGFGVPQVRRAVSRSRRRYGPGTGRHGQPVAEDRSRTVAGATGAGEDRRRCPLVSADDRSTSSWSSVAASRTTASRLGDWRSSSSRVALDRHHDGGRRGRDQDAGPRRSRERSGLLELDAVGVCERGSRLAPRGGGMDIPSRPLRSRRYGRQRDPARSDPAFRVVWGAATQATTPQVLGTDTSSSLVVSRQEDRT